MKIEAFYHVITENGGEVTRKKPRRPYVESYRITPDDGKALVFGGAVFRGAIETDSPDGWEEIDAV